MLKVRRFFRCSSDVSVARSAILASAVYAVAFVIQAQQPQLPPPQQKQPSPAVVDAGPISEPQAVDSSGEPKANPSAAALSSLPASADIPNPAQPAPGAQAAARPAQPPKPASANQPGAISEEELKKMLVGKQFYLRGGYLGDSLTFDEHGHIIGHSPQGSFTLSIVQIDHVRLTKHKVEFEGTRYGLHFNEQLAYEDAANAFDKVRITPKKKVVRITIDRELVVSPKKKKDSANGKGNSANGALALAPAKARPATQSLSNSNADAAAPSSPQAGPQIAAATNPPDSAVTASMAPLPATPSAAPTVRSGTFVEASDPSELSEDDQLKASIAATPAAERPADPSSVTTTTSQAHANQLLLDAVDRTFAPGLDDRMMAAMPDFWKLYYRSLSAKTTDRPADITILRQSTVDQKAHLLTAFEPASNEFAQTAGVAGMALYRTVISADGEPTEIAVARPIGFGLDESAVASIRKAKFSPAIKDGKPVPVMIDLVVQFRIFSNRTAAQGALDTVEKEKVPEPTLPGPYSVSRPN